MPNSVWLTSQEPFTYGAASNKSPGTVLAGNADYVREMLDAWVGVIAQPSPQPGSAEAWLRALMFRDCIDLIAGVAAKAVGVLQQHGFVIVRLSENAKRKQLISAMPFCAHLKETVIRCQRLLKELVAEQWAKDDVGVGELCSLLGCEQAEAFLSGRTCLMGAASALFHVGQLAAIIALVESYVGNFRFWVEHEEASTILALQRSIAKNERDHEDFLKEFFGFEKAEVARILWDNGRSRTPQFKSIADLKAAGLLRLRGRTQVPPFRLDHNPVLSFADLPEPKDSRGTDESSGKWALPTIYSTPGEGVASESFGSAFSHFSEDLGKEEETDIIVQVITALAPGTIEREYLYMRLVQSIPPREIMEELGRRHGPISDRAFENLQRRCNRRIQRARKFVDTINPQTRRAKQEALAKLVSMKIN